MKYNPEAATGMLPPGQYEAVVKVARDKVSKAQQEMIELILTVYGADGRQVDVFDYLLSSDDWQWKVRHFCESAGLDYARGELVAAWCTECNVRVNLGVEKQEGYREKNRVLDYLPRPGTVTATDVRVADDDIPF
jgi:hypothetical protein